MIVHKTDKAENLIEQKMAISRKVHRHFKLNT